MISFGVVTAIVGRAAFFPFPGVDNPAVCVGVENNCTIAEIPTFPPDVFGELTTPGEEWPNCKWPNGSDPLYLYEHQNHGRFVSLSFLFRKDFYVDKEFGSSRQF